MIPRLLNPLAAATALALAACATPGAIQPVAALRNAATLDAGRDTTHGKSVQAQWPAERRCQPCADAQTGTLIDHALAHNPSRVEAGARSGAADSGGGVNARLARTRFTENYLDPSPRGGSLQPDNQALAQVGRGPDLWRADEKAIAAALSLQQAGAVPQRAAELPLATAMTRAYIGLALHYELQDAYRDALADTQRALDVTEREPWSGISTKLAVEQARSEIPEAKPQLQEVALTIARVQLAAPIGEGPGGGDTVARPRLGDAADAVCAGPRAPRARPANESCASAGSTPRRSWLRHLAAA